MHFKLIFAFVECSKTGKVLDSARQNGAKGATVISQVRGEGVELQKTFLGLNIEAQIDVILLLVEEHLARTILETVAEVGEFEVGKHKGIALQLDVEDAVGVAHQIEVLNPTVRRQI